jgi:periplasmic divalent cation tolerance protein
MKSGGKFRVVLVTCRSLKEARRLARHVVSTRLAACANIVRGPVESFYTWKGKLESAREHLLVIKTVTARLAELEREARRLHSYDVPEFLALPVSAGSSNYLSWLDASTRANKLLK